MSIVPGANWIGYKFTGGFWLPYICARSGNINIQTGMIETTGPGDGNYISQKPTVHSFTAQLDGIVSLNEASSVTAPDLLLLQLAKEKLLWRFEQTSLAGDTFIKQAYFYINSYTDTGSFDGVATFSVSMVGTGAMSVIFTPPPPNNGEVFRYPAMGDTAPTTPDVNTILVPGLGNKNIIEVVKDGRGNNDIILTGTPVNQEVLYETEGDDGRFTWAFPFMPGESWYTVYQNL